MSKNYFQLQLGLQSVHFYYVWTPKTNILFDYIYKIICGPFINSLSSSSSTIHQGLQALLAGHGELALGQGGEALRLDKTLFDYSHVSSSRSTIHIKWW
jgi:hypothetical protein